MGSRGFKMKGWKAFTTKDHSNNKSDGRAGSSAFQRTITKEIKKKKSRLYAGTEKSRLHQGSKGMSEGMSKGMSEAMAEGIGMAAVKKKSPMKQITEKEKAAGVDKKYKRLKERKVKANERGMKARSKGNITKSERLYEKADKLHDKRVEHRQKNVEKNK